MPSKLAARSVRGSNTGSRFTTPGALTLSWTTGPRLRHIGKNPGLDIPAVYSKWRHDYNRLSTLFPPPTCPNNRDHLCGLPPSPKRASAAGSSFFWLASLRFCACRSQLYVFAKVPPSLKLRRTNSAGPTCNQILQVPEHTHNLTLPTFSCFEVGRQ